MPKTTFVRKPYNLADVERGTEEIRAMRRQKGQPELQEDYYIAEEIKISGAEWCSLSACLPKSRNWLKAFSERNYTNDGGGVPCLRVTSECSENALLIDTQGYDYARYVAIEDAVPASSQIKEKPENEVTLRLTQEELQILFTAVCQQRGKVGELISQMAGCDLAIDEARALSNHLGDLTSRLCDLMND